MSAGFALGMTILVFASMWACYTIGFRNGYIQSCEDSLRRMRDIADEIMEKHEND